MYAFALILRTNSDYLAVRLNRLFSVLVIRAVVDKLVLKEYNLDQFRASGSLTELTGSFFQKLRVVKDKRDPLLQFV
jgi:hypothetical protein